MFTPKMVKKVLWVLLWAVLACGLVYPGYAFIKNARENARKGEATATFWLPKNAEIVTDRDGWWAYLRNLEKEGRYHKIQLGISEYKRLFCEGEHRVFLSFGKVTFVTLQGQIIVSSEESFNSPSFVPVKAYQHTGDGVVKFELTGDVNYVSVVVVGLLCGLMLDSMIASVCGICLLAVGVIQEKIRGY